MHFFRGHEKSFIDLKVRLEQTQKVTDLKMMDSPKGVQIKLNNDQIKLNYNSVSLWTKRKKTRNKWH